MSVLDLRHRVDGEPDHSVRIAVAAGWLTSNQRGAWTKHHKLIAQWRQMAAWAAVRARVPQLGRAYVLAELRFTDRRRRDPANWYPTVKAAIDGFVDADVLPGDWSYHLIGPDMRIGPVAGIGHGALHLHLWEVADDDRAASLVRPSRRRAAGAENGRPRPHPVRAAPAGAA